MGMTAGEEDRKAFEFPDINDGWEEYRAVCRETGLEVSRKTARIWQASLAYARQPQSAAIEAPRDKVCAEIQEIMQTYREQEAEGRVDTPGWPR